MQSDSARLTCRVCGAPVPRGVGRTPRELHEPCKRFVNFLAAAERALREIEWYETTAGRSARKKTRGNLIALANGFPVNWHRLRDSRGRFTKRGSYAKRNQP